MRVAKPGDAIVLGSEQGPRFVLQHDQPSSNSNTWWNAFWSMVLWLWKKVLHYY